MKYTKKILTSLLGAILLFLLLGLGYSLFIGRSITLNHYYSINNISYMSISLDNNDGITLKHELSTQQIDDFLKQFGFNKIYKPFFGRSFIAKQTAYHIDIRLRDDKNKFDLVFPLTDQGEINLLRYTFYPYKVQHVDMYNYLLNLLENSSN